MADKVIGIDLGTTNSVVSVMEGGDPVVYLMLRAGVLRRRSSVLRRTVSVSSARSRSGRR